MTVTRECSCRQRLLFRPSSLAWSDLARHSPEKPLRRALARVKNDELAQYSLTLFVANLQVFSSDDRV